jgi:hypothetical protein
VATPLPQVVQAHRQQVALANSTKPITQLTPPALFICIKLFIQK